MKSILSIGAGLLTLSTVASGADLSPTSWPAGVREQAEQIEAQRWDPQEAQTVTGRQGVISATVSPIAVQAGLQVLRQNGNAADAAATVALTQITTQLGSVVSYAGIMTLLYYDAKTGKVYSLDGGYNSYQNETDPKTIPVSDLGSLNMAARPPTQGGAKGRETLVPGFMAGIEAMHQRFGKLPFKVLFEPALWYAKNGVTISPHLAGFFPLRQSFLARTPAGQRFLKQAGHELPQTGDKFVQPELAETLAAVAKQGARYMYTGAWGKAFVEAVQRDGGKATLADLQAYRATWSEPYTDSVFGHTVYVNGVPNFSAYQVLTGLKMAEALKLEQRGPYWSDPTTFRDLARIGEFVVGAPTFSPMVLDALRSKGIDASPENQRTKAFGEAVAPLLSQLFAAVPGKDPHHSNSIVVVDKTGNIAVLTHSINTVIWGDTGIVVGGIPLPDSAGFQQERLALHRPGERLPNEIACTLTFAGTKPVLATAPIGSSLIPETLKTILSVIGQKQDLAVVTAAPPLFINLDFSAAPKPLSERPVNVPADAYDTKFLDQVRALGVSLTTLPAATAGGLRGTLSTAAIDPATGRVSSPEVPRVMVFSGAN